MTLVYILSGILLLGALSYLGIRREKQERQRSEREELAGLEGAGRTGHPVPAVADPKLLSIWDPSRTGTGISVHLGTNSRDPILWRPLELPNPLLLIVGGSGKSQVPDSEGHRPRAAGGLRRVILDLHGDLDIEGAATHELHFRSRYGINPLVLSLDQRAEAPTPSGSSSGPASSGPSPPWGACSWGCCWLPRACPGLDPGTWSI